MLSAPRLTFGSHSYPITAPVEFVISIHVEDVAFSGTLAPEHTKEQREPAAKFFVSHWKVPCLATGGSNGLGGASHSAKYVLQM